MVVVEVVDIIAGVLVTIPRRSGVVQYCLCRMAVVEGMVVAAGLAEAQIVVVIVVAVPETVESVVGHFATEQELLVAVLVMSQLLAVVAEQKLLVAAVAG